MIRIFFISLFFILPLKAFALIDKSKEESAEVLKKKNNVTQDQEKNLENSGLSLSEEDA